MNSDKATIKVYETKEKRKFYELYQKLFNEIKQNEKQLKKKQKKLNQLEQL